MSYKHDDRLQIVFKKTREFRKTSSPFPAIHCKIDSIDELTDYINTADRDNFDLIYVYSTKLRNRFYKEFGSKKTTEAGTIWGKLIELTDADVRCGMVQKQFGQYVGDGFTLFDWR